MILYVWINNYKNLKHIGINLTSKYEFTFNFKVNNGGISGDLSYEEVGGNTDIFNEYVTDLKAIIGKNGTGKSSILFCLIDNILTDYPRNFDGIVVTDKYIFNRSGIDISGEVIIDGVKLREIKNAEICNFGRFKHEKKLTEDEAKNQKGYRIIDSFLSNHSLFYYSPLLNYDRIFEGETVVAGNHIYEVDYYRFFDLSTESQIHNDANQFLRNIPLKLTSVSETLCHKSKESERILNYLFETKDYPFEIKLPTIKIHLNQYDTNFWEDISRIFQNDQNNRNLVEDELHRVSDGKMLSGWNGFKEELYKRVILSLLAFEVEHRYSFGSYGELNALTYTMSKFLKISKKAKNLKSLLETYIKNLDIAPFEFPTLFKQLNAFVNFLEEEFSKENIQASTFELELSFSQKQFLNRFLELTNGFSGFKNNELFSIYFPIFSYDFPGLSSGEKSFLHLLSRFHYSFKFLENGITDFIIFLDEPEIGFHPQWQKRIISVLCNYFQKELSGRKVQLIITGHSPIIISDLPRNNLVLLDLNAQGEPFVSSLKNTDNTFAANIHALYADAFFIQNGTIGEFAKSQIQRVIDILKRKDQEQKAFAQKIIAVVGDPLIRQRLEEMYFEAFTEEIESEEERITRLEMELAYLKAKKDENRR